MRGVLEASPVYRSFRMPSLWRPVILIGVVMLLAGVASGPLAQRISAPIERLTAVVRRFGEGDLSARVTPPRERWRLRARHRPPDELEQLTRAFNEMAERIEMLVRGQKELLANVSHELRSPLARIRVALELLPRDAKNETRLRDVEADLVELDRLIEDVLTATRLEASGLPAHLGAVDVAMLLASLVERAAHDPATAGKTVRASGGEGIVVTADGALLKRALWNLVENAAKYGAPPIELGASRDDNTVALVVKDAGAGIAPEERERVFEPFYRGDKARTPRQRLRARAHARPPRRRGARRHHHRRRRDVHAAHSRVATSACVASPGRRRGRRCRRRATDCAASASTPRRRRDRPSSASSSGSPSSRAA